MTVILTKFLSRTYSFRKRLVRIFSFVLILFFMIFVWIAWYFNISLQEKTYESVRDTLEVYNHQLTHNLDKLHIFMYDMSEYSLDMSEVVSEPDESQIFNHIIRTKELLDYSIPSFTEIDGMFLYAPINDTFIQSYKYQDGPVVSSYIKDQFRNSKSYENVQTKAWYSEKINNNYYLIRIIEMRGSYIGSWANVTQLTSTFKNVSDLNGNIVYVDNEGNALSSDAFKDYTFPIHLSLDTYHIIDIDSQKALLVLNKIDYCDYYMAAVIPLHSINSQLAPLYRLIVILLLVIPLFSALLLFSVSKFLSKPMHLLEDAAQQMREGNFEQKLPQASSNCHEIIEIDTAYNRMIDEIHNLRIHIYEETITKSHIELQYLKAQIAPHFLINCLFSIMTLAEQPLRNQEILHSMIETLADHLRYTLSDQTTVSLEKEMAYVHNYIELTKLRFPGCLFFEADIEIETFNASVFPLILLMLTENSIKYNMVMGESLTIKISAHVITQDNVKRLHMSHMDNGTGFSEEQLNRFNDFVNNLYINVVESDGNHLGIPNVAKRIRIVYGNQGFISFSNELDAGARIDIDIPYIPHTN